MSGKRVLGRLLILAGGTLGVTLVGVTLFVVVPETLTELLGIGLALLVAIAGIRFSGSIARSMFPGYNVAEVEVSGPIVREPSGGVPARAPRGTPADDIVDQIDRANDDTNVDALLLKLNTPGGQVVPSDDIKLAAERFDGPTVAYATDQCASGGYWIASGCDELWAREGTLVGSIGVVGSRVTAADLADKVGLRYEQFTAGEYKDAGVPLRDLEEDEREYLQGLVDGYYDSFVERVSEGRDLEPSFVRDTEARIYLGTDAHECGLVDELGTQREVEAAIASRLERDPSAIVVETFEPDRPLVARLGSGAQSLAYAFGAGIAGLRGEGSFRLRS